MDSTALLLARIQFAFTISVHIIFPVMTIGLASFLAILEHAGCVPAAIAARWFSTPNIYYFLPVPLLVLLVAHLLLRSLQRRPHAGPFVLTLCLVFLGFSGLAISLWPHIVMPVMTIWQASAPPQSQGFALVGALFIIPFILAYTAWSYYMFRGKVKPGEAYH